MTFKEYADYDGVGLAALIRGKDVSAGEALDAAIGLAEKHNPALNAIVYKFYDDAQARARSAPGEGPFAGVPFLLKDIAGDMAGVPTRFGSAFWPAFPAPHNATLTDRFLKAGVVPFGKTNVPEYGLLPITEPRLYGPARNPWNTDHTPGGSSGGAAAAVAAGIVPMAHANDGGGSIRIPASSCGLVGLKPTRARNPLGPDLGDALSGFISDHIVSRSVRDTAVMLDATHGPELGDPYFVLPPTRPFADALDAKPKTLRIAFATKDLTGRDVHPDCVAAVRAAAALCEALGHHVEEASPPVDGAILMERFMPIWASSVVQLIDGIASATGATPNAQDLEGLTLGLYEQGKTISGGAYLSCVMAFQHAARAVARWHEAFDVWLTPTLGAPPLKIGTVDLSERDPVKAFAPIIDYVPFTPLQNATGQPAINVPLHWNEAGLPVGTQFVGRFGDEATLLALAAELELARPWKDKRPPIYG